MHEDVVCFGHPVQKRTPCNAKPDIAVKSAMLQLPTCHSTLTLTAARAMSARELGSTSSAKPSRVVSDLQHARRASSSKEATDVTGMVRQAASAASCVCLVSAERWGIDQREGLTCAVQQAMHIFSLLVARKCAQDSWLLLHALAAARTCSTSRVAYAAQAGL